MDPEKFSPLEGSILKSRVSIVRTEGNDEKKIASAVRESIRLIGGLRDIVHPGDLVLIKPNLVAVPETRLSGAVTRWEVCRAIADMVMEIGAEPVIAESSAAGVNTEEVIQAAGYQELRDQGYQVLSLDDSPKAALPIPRGRVFPEVAVFELVKRADVLISVPVMKTHDQTEVTLSLKNMKGTLQDFQKKAFHKQGLLEAVVDLNERLKPALTVIDGTFGQEGLGPIFGSPVEMDLILASKDLVAADAVAGKIMGYDPEEVMITRKAAARGLGEMDLSRIEVQGLQIADVQRRFKRACETSIPDLPPFELLLDEGACTGCRNTVISSIMDMKAQGLEGALEGKYIVAGPLEAARLPRDLRKEDIVLVGLCTKHLAEKGLGNYVQGCPPNNIFVVRGIVGEDHQVERRYATESGTD